MATFLFVILAGPALADDGYGFAGGSGRFRRGGSISAVEAHMQSGYFERRLEGDYMSAHTILVAQPGACVFSDTPQGPRTRFWFHGARSNSQSFSSDVDWWGNARLDGYYAKFPRLRKAVFPFLGSIEFHTLTGSQMIALGVPACR